MHEEFLRVCAYILMYFGKKGHPFYLCLTPCFEEGAHASSMCSQKVQTATWGQVSAYHFVCFFFCYLLNLILLYHQALYMRLRFISHTMKSNGL